MPKMPMAIGTKSSPSASERLSNVNRCVPVNASRPTVASSSPRHAAVSAFVRPPLLTVATSRMPSSARTVYSGGPKSSAKLATTGATSVSAMIETVPPTKDPIAAIPSAVPARPLRAMA